MQLTCSYIIDKERLPQILLHQDGLIAQSNSPYYLLIYSTRSQYTKITIYPVTTIPIRKYFIRGETFTQESVKELHSQLTGYHPTILHTSGIVLDSPKYIYEIYFSGVNDTDIKYLTQELIQIQGIDSIEDFIIAPLEN